MNGLMEADALRSASGRPHICASEIAGAWERMQNALVSSELAVWGRRETNISQARSILPPIMNQRSPTTPTPERSLRE